MAANRFSLNEGSLTRRTILHVIAFVLGTALFLAVASLVLVTVSTRVAGGDKSASGDDAADDSAAAATASAPVGKPILRPPGKKKGAPKPAEDEDQ